MKLLLVGNHTCGNRGDGAILRGLVTAIEAVGQGTDITIMSRHPVSSSYLLGRPIEPDRLAAFHVRLKSGRMGQRKARIAERFVPALMRLAVDRGWRWPLRLLPGFVLAEIERLKEFDAVIQVGGSFFVDLYGPLQYEYPFAAILAGRPLHLIGHSMGPFEGRRAQVFASTLLSHATTVILREQISREIIEQDRLPTSRLVDGTDTAWAVVPTRGTRHPPRWVNDRADKRPLIAVTIRELAPFDRRLGTTQAAYERAFVALIDALIAHGYDVLAASTCTGIDSYHRDDRMNALRIGSMVQDAVHYHTVMDELDDVGLGELFAECTLLVGTRLHSAIIAMNFGTPAVAINYEHKSEGVMRQLGLPELSRPVDALLDGTLLTHVLSLLSEVDSLRARVHAAVSRERAATQSIVARCLTSIQSKG